MYGNSSAYGRRKALKVVRYGVGVILVTLVLMQRSKAGGRSQKFEIN
jgi:preprotein translocase subunit SecG